MGAVRAGKGAAMTGPVACKRNHGSAPGMAATTRCSASASDCASCAPAKEAPHHFVCKSSSLCDGFFCVRRTPAPSARAHAKLSANIAVANTARTAAGHCGCARAARKKRTSNEALCATSSSAPPPPPCIRTTQSTHRCIASCSEGAPLRRCAVIPCTRSAAGFILLPGGSATSVPNPAPPPPAAQQLPI